MLGAKATRIDTGIPFFDHMLSQVAMHSGIKMTIKAKGDLKVDFHHTVEDVGIALGLAIDQSLEDKAEVERYGDAHVPMDMTLTRCAIDLSGRGCLAYDVQHLSEKVGEFDTYLVREFFEAVSRNAKMAVHIDTLRVDVPHHVEESVFKAFGRALKKAVAKQSDGVLSTKGAL